MTESGLSASGPIDEADLRRIWDEIAAPDSVLLAVSGGSDSIALMRLAAPLHKSGRSRIDVATVDHRLRAASREEAEFVGRAARELGLGHEILEWNGRKPETGIQEAARQARYFLLAEHASRIGAGAIVTAHTADDQAETVLMRAARGSGPRGLGAMNPDTLVAAGPSAPLRLLRPLLGVRRRRLIEHLERAGARFIDDPSNRDPSFERVRVRSALCQLDCHGVLSVDALVITAAEMRGAAARLAACENDRFAALGGVFDALGGAVISVEGVSDADAPLIARLVAAVSGASRRPKDSVALSMLRTAQRQGRATLCGALIRVDGVIRICRESAGLSGRAGAPARPPHPIGARSSILWDRRFIVRNDFDAEGGVRPLAREARKLALAAEDEPALEAAPGLWVRGRLVAAAGASDAASPLAEERFFRPVNRFEEPDTFVNAAGGAGLP